MKSFAHPAVACLLPNILTSRSAYTTPWYPLHVYIPLFPHNLFFPHLRQYFLKLLICRILAPLCIPSSTPLPRNPSCLCTLQIAAVTLPTVPRLPAITLCRSLPTAFPPLPALIPPWVYPVSRLSTVAPASL